MMDLSVYKTLTIDGVELKKLVINGVEVWSLVSYTNMVPLSINADGTIYNNGLGYKGGYRVRSGGAEGATTQAACTGYISVNGGDVVRIYPIDTDYLSASGTAINVYDASFTNLGQAASNGAYGIFLSTYTGYSWGNGGVNEGDGVYRWVVPPSGSGVKYIRVSIATNDGGHPGADMVVTVNEEIV